MTSADLFAGVELGGTKVVCVIGSGPGDIRFRARLPTRAPAETIAAIVSTLGGKLAEHGPVAGLGIACFGPLDRDPGSSGWGHVTATPKPDWSGTDVAGAIGRALDLAVAFDTDVAGAALAEGLWGAAQDVADHVYVTVGTGIGGAVVSGGRLVHGAMHSEMGHIAVPHDRAADPYPGCCPFHGDCLEGLAAGPAIAARWGRPASELPPDHPAWALEADYLAALATTLIYVLAPRRILFGGGVSEAPGLVEAVRRHTHARLAGYPATPPFDGDLDDVITRPGLGAEAGPLGALALARLSPRRRPSPARGRR